MSIRNWGFLLWTTGLLAAPAVLAQGPAVGAAPADGVVKEERGVTAEEESGDEGPGIRWMVGPMRVELGDDLAQLELPEGYAVAGPDDARTILSQMGNRPDGDELGLLIPTAEGQDWFVLFQWQDVGYVKDDEKDEIDADAILKSIQDATEAGNDWRRENGISPMRVTGWAEKPHYDEVTNNLVWATLAVDENGEQSVNYNMRYLGRRGVVSATLVESAELLAASKPFAMAALKDFSFKTGSRYSEWKVGDKVSEYGLTALVAAGAGAAAVKLGLFGILAKFFGKAGKALVMAAVALFAGIGRFFNSLRGRKAEVQVSHEPPPAE